MMNPENHRLLADERSALDAETALAREEQRLWQRLEAALSDALDKRTQGLVTRIGALEANPDVNAADVSRARTIALAGSAPDPVIAQGERGAALSARRGALQARELAVKALGQALSAVEASRQARQKELDQAEQLLTAAESGAKRSADDRRRHEEQAKKAQAEAAARAEAERRAAEDKRRAAEKSQAAASAAYEMKTEPNMRAVSAFDLRTEPGQQLAAQPVETRTEPGLQPVQAPVTRTEPTGPALRPVAGKAAAQPAQPGQKKVSRRRRVRVAPPPKAVEVEVAVHGDNNFYTGFDNSISNGGLFITSLETLPKGHELDLNIHLEGRSITTRGRVVFQRADNLANPECTSGAGLKLLSLSRDQSAAIEQFFQRRAPMFFVQP